MLSYFYDPSMFILLLEFEFVENVVFEREHAWRPRCHLVPPACVLGTLSKDDDDGSKNVGEKNEFAFFQT